jgi:hypothetical protein
VGGRNISCFGASDGSINLTPSGGCSPYTFQWFRNGLPYATTEDLTNIPFGSYQVIVTDANGCQRTLFPVTMTQPSQYVHSISSPTYASGHNISCFGATDGSIDLTVSGSTPPYTYIWSNGATTQDLSNVGAGTYTVTVSDANGCSFTRTITLTQPDGLVLSTCPNQNVVFGYYPENVARITTNLSGGVGPYYFLWSTGETTDKITVAPTGTTTYTVTVTDLNGCSATAGHTVTVTDVRCGTGLLDVRMCDNNNKNQCVKLADVPKRLSEGWKLGNCSPLVNLNPGTCGNPVIPGCACQGGVKSVTLQYFGAAPNATIQVYNKSNLTELIATFTGMNAGDMFTVTPHNNNATFGSQIFVRINGSGTATAIPTACNTIQSGANIGVFTVAQYVDAYDNTCNGDVVSCLCQDYLMLLQVKYRGASGATVRVWENRNKTNLVQTFTNVQQGDTLLINGTLLTSGRLSGETVFEVVGSGKPDVYVNTDCNKGGMVGRIYGDFLVTGYVDKKNNACNMPAPCPCTTGVAVIGVVYNGPANGTLYAFTKASHVDTLGRYPNLYPGDTIIISAQFLNLMKLEDNTYFRLHGTSSDFIVPTKCGTYIQDQTFGLLTVFGYIDATGQECNLSSPPRCNCVGGIKSLTVEYQEPDTVQIPRTVYVFADGLRLDTLGVFYNVVDGTEMFVSGANLPGGILKNFTFFYTVGAGKPDTKIPTYCGATNWVGSTFEEIYVTAMEDSAGNKCSDTGPTTCEIGKTLMCHTPKHGHGNRGPHQHCVKNKDVAKKLKKASHRNHQGEWVVGPCPFLREAAGDEPQTAIERVADGRMELSAFPNPFNEATTIRFRLPESSNVKLAIYTITGQEVAKLYEGTAAAGKDYKFEFKAANHPYGMYFYRLELNGGKTYTNKLVLTK